jgi:hypothetical protein
MKHPCWFVYWLYSDHGTNPRLHGYVGVTCSLFRRIWHHHNRGLPAFKVKILLRGTQDQCLELEKRLRPTQDIGWNTRAGGPTYQGNGKSQIIDISDTRERGANKPKSAETRAKMRASALARYADPAERSKTQKAVKKAFENIDRSGKNNSRFGKHCSEETKQRMRDTIAKRRLITPASARST